MTTTSILLPIGSPDPHNPKNILDMIKEKISQTDKYCEDQSDPL